MKNLSKNGSMLPKYEKLTEFIVRNIQNGIYPDGHPLPSETALANELGVSRATVREALEMLSKRNVISKSQGRRSMVNASAVRGRPRSLHFGWISRDPLSGIMSVYLEIYTELQKAILGVNGNLLFLPLINPREEEWGCSMLDNLDGVFLAGIRKGTLIPKLADRLGAMPNVIEIDDIEDSPATCTICTDNYAAGKRAALYLAGKERKTVVFVSNYNAFYRGFHDRARGVIDGFAECGVVPVLANCDDSKIGTEAFDAVLKNLLKEHPDLDTVWHATDDAALRIREQLERVAPRPTGFYRSAGVDGIVSILNGKKYHLSLQHPSAEIARQSFQTMMAFTSGNRSANANRQIDPILLPWTE